MRKYYWYISIFLKKHGVTVLASVVFAVLFLSLFITFGLRLFEFKKKSYIGIVGQHTLDNLPESIAKEISNGLTQIREDGSAAPSLAERWNTEESGKTYRFLIRKNLVWHDGKEFTPEDVTYNIRDVQVITTQNEVIFKLNTPFVPFPTTVSRPLFRSITKPYLFFFQKRSIVGTGPFQVVEYKEKGQRLSELIIESQQEQKIYRFYLTEDEAIDGFKRGEVDELKDFSGPRELASWSTVNIKQSLDTSRYLGVFFNSKAFSNEVRQALNYALPKPTDTTRAVGPINPKSWAFANVGKTYDFDEARAIERLLSANGIPREPLTFELTTTPNFITEAEEIKKHWESFGQKAAAACQTNKDVKEKNLCENTKVKVNIRISNFPNLEDFQVLLIGQQIPVDPDQYQLWHTDLPTNFTGYSNTRIDSLLERGRQTEDQQKRFEIYSDFQQFFTEDTPVIFIRHLYRYDIQRN